MSSIIDTRSSIQQILLEKLKIKQQIEFPDHMIKYAQIDTMVDHAWNQLVIGMSAYVTAGSWTEKSPSGQINNYWVFPEIPPNPDRNICKFLVSYYEASK